MGPEIKSRRRGRSPQIVTVGVCPCWDVVCHVEGISWGDHAKITSQRCVPAGKSLNVSKALAWMGAPSVAAGLWGQSDYDSMAASLDADRDLVGVHLTAAAGQTRHNVTVVDTRNSREMHLRAPSALATAESLRALSEDLSGLVAAETVFVFAGSLPEDELLGGVIEMIRGLRRCGARIVVDTSQNALKRLVETGDIDVIKPNLAELRDLVGSSVGDDMRQITSAAQSISGVRTVLVSRGANGAVAVRGKEAFSGAACDRDRSAASTVGCGDWLLAGFLSASDEPLDAALARALRVATAKAWGWHESKTWHEAAAAIEVEVTAAV
ncbi:MAG: hypothetical protein IH624_05705 [Phycisphaerae bacterium]|nr:hypothetical protein [Phycisphaerae bacterium]